jgi:hypothetical protein
MRKRRRNLLRQFDVHTLLRLPTGIFFAQGGGGSNGKTVPVTKRNHNIGDS